MRFDTYLFFSGNCEKAFKFYEQALGGKIENVITHGGSPVETNVPPEWRDKILHIRLVAGDGVLMGSDSPPGHYEEPRGFSVAVGLKDQAKGEKIFRSLSEGGKVTLPFEQTFWASRFGMLIDKFGIPWMISCE